MGDEIVDPEAKLCRRESRWRPLGSTINWTETDGETGLFDRPV